VPGSLSRTAKNRDKLLVGPEKVEILDGHKGFFAGGEPTSDLLGDPYRHAILSLFVTKPREERIVFSTAQHYEFFAGLGFEELGLHDRPALSIDIATMSNGSDLQTVPALEENHSIVAVSQAKTGGANHPLNVARAIRAVSIESGEDTLLYRRRQFPEGSGGRRGKYERLAHDRSIGAEAFMCNTLARGERVMA
jgi:hypothetical protein